MHYSIDFTLTNYRKYFLESRMFSSNLYDFHNTIAAAKTKRTLPPFSTLYDYKKFDKEKIREKQQQTKDYNLNTICYRRFIRIGKNTLKKTFS